MRTATFAQAIEEAIAQAMADDERIIVIGEDVRMIRLNLFSRFGKERIRAAPISESAFVGAAVGAAMAGMRPIVEVMLVDFIGVAADALLNHAAKVHTFSGGKWDVPMVVRAACGAGYGDGGQHMQSLWGWLAHIPGLTIVVPSTPADAGGLMISAISHHGPVIYLEHKLLSDYWLDYLGSGGRDTVSYDIPENGAKGPVPDTWEPVPLGRAMIWKTGADVTIAGVGVSVHRSMEAAGILKQKGIEAEVIDLRTVSPLDKETLCTSVAKTGHLLAVDEDYEGFGLSGEIAALVLENNIDFRYKRVCTRKTIPYCYEREQQVLPHTGKITDAALKLISPL